MSVTTCTDIVKALSKVCEHRKELQELFDTKFAEIQFAVDKYKDNDTQARLDKFKLVYDDLNRLVSMCDDVDYTKKEDG